MGPNLAAKTKDIVRLGGSHFRGDINTLEVNKCINNLPTYFTLVDYTEVEKTKGSAFLRKDEARNWWKSLDKRGIDSQNMNWESVKAAYRVKYIPPGVKRQMEDSFAELVQGAITVC